MVIQLEGINLEEVWEMAQSYTAWHYRSNRHSDLEEILGVASEATVTFALEWPAWCEKTNADPTAQGLFFTLLKRRINWKLWHHFDKAPRDLSLDPEIDDGYVRTQLRAPHRDSLLQRQIVASMAETMNLRERLTLAFVCFEEMGVKEVARLFGVAHPAIGQAIRRGAEQVLLVAIATLTPRTDTEPHQRKKTQWQPPEQVVAWIREHYDTDPATYVRYVEAHYLADVSYLTEILDRANGEGPNRGIHQGPDRMKKLTVEQQQEIYQRIDAGEIHANIAADYNVSRGLVSTMGRSKRMDAA